MLDPFAEPSPADKAFWKFHKENPKVFEEIVGLARQAYRARRKRIGMKMLFEIIRWQRMVVTTGDHFKINNNYAPRYTRLLIEKYPEFSSMFETRRIRT